MATKRKLQIRYGAAASRPTLATGEWGLDTDTNSEAVYIGTPAGNKAVATLGVKKYVAILTQSDTSAPVATVLENTLGGAVVWTYTNLGIYTGTLASAFTVGKTVVVWGSIVDATSGITFESDTTGNTLVIGTASGGSYANDVLSATAISVTVYP